MGIKQKDCGTLERGNDHNWGVPFQTSRRRKLDCRRLEMNTMRTEELIEEAVSLPVEARAHLAECVLQSLNATDAAVDVAWAAEAQRRLAELRSGAVEAVPGELVFARIRQRFAR